MVPPFRVAPRGRPVPHNPEANIFMDDDKLMAYTNQSFSQPDRPALGRKAWQISVVEAP